MRIVATSVYVGPNIYALFPVIRHTLDLGELEGWPSGKLGPEFNDRLIAALPRTHKRRKRERGGSSMLEAAPFASLSMRRSAR